MQSGRRVAAHELRRQAIAQPAPRAGDDFHLVRAQADLLRELAVQRLFGPLAAADPALRELPAARGHAPADEDLAVVVHQDDADVRPVAVGIDVVRFPVHGRDFNRLQCAHGEDARDDP